MAEYHMTKIYGRVVKDLVVYFTNGCTKWPIQPTNRFPKEKFPPFRHVKMVIALSRFRFWMDYTTSTEEWPERFKRPAVIPEEIEFRMLSCF
jgi:hypothetical protein